MLCLCNFRRLKAIAVWFESLLISVGRMRGFWLLVSLLVCLTGKQIVPDKIDESNTEDSADDAVEEAEDIDIVCDAIEGMHAADVWAFLAVNHSSEMERMGFDVHVDLSEHDQIGFGFILLDICDE